MLIWLRGPGLGVDWSGNRLLVPFVTPFVVPISFKFCQSAVEGSNMLKTA